jgi:hypothetical protein
MLAIDLEVAYSGAAEKDIAMLDVAMYAYVACACIVINDSCTANDVAIYS